MYMHSVPKVKSIKELEQIEKDLAEAHFAGKLEETLNALHFKKKFIWDIPIQIERFPETKEKYEEYKQADGHVVKIRVDMALGYWRKFNALHAWFVENVQKGTDDCNRYIVTEHHLLKLQKDLNEITPENAESKLPTQGGFFFGNTDYDDYYWASVERLKAFVMYVLCHVNLEERTLIYQSSW